MAEHYEPVSDEAVGDDDFAVFEAFDTVPTDPFAIEAIVGEAVDGDVAVIYPGARSPRRAEVDGTDMEAIFDDESREMANLEAEYQARTGDMPDLVELHAEHLGAEAPPER